MILDSISSVARQKIEQFTIQEAKRRQRGAQGTRNEERTESESG